MRAEKNCRQTDRQTAFRLYIVDAIVIASTTEQLEGRSIAETRSEKPKNNACVPRKLVD